MRLPEALSRYAGGETALEVAGITVGEALEAAFRRHPDLRVRLVDEDGAIHPHLAVFRNESQLDRRAASAVPLEAGDILTLLVAVDGG